MQGSGDYSAGEWRLQCRGVEITVQGSGDYSAGEWKLQAPLTTNHQDYCTTSIKIWKK